ncbi:hypothetical protein GE09DRAFT_1221048 [Coniochaeta sp. 2T2.1]|nr:hypothetical protein GE09DRAFT_1221048 [Coniochaeta sp. 2T2.1]
MPAPRNSRKRRATEESSDPFESSPAPSTRSSKRLATARASTSSADRPEPSSIRAAAPKRKAPVKRTATKKEPVEEPITFESSDIEEVEEVIDLVDKDVPDEPPKPKPENTVKLGQFQCVICMDDVTDLTVTHCGHLFCSECLHSSLHIDASKKVCPICRQKVETNPASGKFTAKSKGFWPLELKLMTSKRSGKRAAR